MNLLKLLLATAEEGGAQEPAGGCNSPIPMIVIFVVLIAAYVWMTVSSRKRQKEEQAKVQGIKVGDKVKTIGGVCGIIVEINDDENTFVIETGTEENKSYVKFDKAAIYQTQSMSEPETEEAPEVFEEATQEEPTVEENSTEENATNEAENNSENKEEKE